MMEGTWKKVTNKADTSNAVHAGTDKDGSPTYVARAPFTTQIIPGKLVVRQKKIYFYYCYGGAEFGVDTNLVEFLVNDGYYWETEQRSNGELPANAVVGGKGVYNMAHYIGRTYHEGCWIPGKIDGLNKCLFIPYAGEEYRKDEYYVLVKPANSTSNENTARGCLGCLKSIGRIFTNCKINITNCTCFKIN